MIYSISGKLTAKKNNFVVVEAQGLGFKIFVSPPTLSRGPKINSKIKLFCHTNIKQDGIDFYGFLSEKELEIFEMLNTVKGVGPKMALKVLGAVNNAEKLLAIISKKRSDILAKTSGIGKKTAERIILELTEKMKNLSADAVDIDNEDDQNLEKILLNIGFKKNEIQEAIKKIAPKTKKTEEKLKAVLKIIGKI